MNSLCFTLNYKMSKSKCRLSFSENPDGKPKVITGRFSLTLIGKISEAFHKIPNKQKWAKLRIAHTLASNSQSLIANTSQHFITEIFVKYSDLSKQFGLKEEELQEAANERRLERLINEILDSKQKPWGFTDKELFEARVERTTLNQILKALPKEIEGEKIYYDIINRKWVVDKTGYSAENLVTIRKLDEYSYLLKSGHISAEGVSKKVFFEPDLLKKKITVRTKELLLKDSISDEGKKIEAELLDKLKDVPEVVHCESMLERKRSKEEKVYQEYILEYCELGTLAESFQSLSRNEKIDIYIDVLKGLEILHKNEYLHFDLHFGNILLKKIQGRIGGKLSDFGNARNVNNIQKPLYFLVNMIDNRYWSPNWTAFSPELIQYRLEIMLQKVAEKKEEYQFFERYTDDKNRIKQVKNYLKVLEEYPKSPLSKKNLITTRSDIWQLGVMMALHHYDVDPEKLKSINYVVSLPSYLHFLCTFAHHGFKCVDMNVASLFECFKSAFKEVEEPKYKKSFDYIMWRMLQPNPAKRPDASEVIDLLYELKK